MTGLLHRIAGMAWDLWRYATGADIVGQWYRDHDDLVAALGEDGAHELLTECYRVRWWM